MLDRGVTLPHNPVEPMSAKDHPCFDVPAEDTVIWRYMDFTKFVDLLEQRTLFFCASSNFEDPFEGSMPPANVAALRQMLSDLKQVDRFMAERAAINEAARRHMFINCWHMNEHESAAMWKLYARTNEAIAVRSTYKSLRAVLPDDEKQRGCVYIGRVNYVDYAKEFIPDGNVFWPFVHKRLSFAHERELRAIWSVLPIAPQGGIDYSLPAPPGHSVPVDIDTLIEAVYVAPTCPGWFAQLVKRVVKRYKLQKDVIQSALDAKPVF